MTEAAIRESVTLAGRAERARVARAFVGAVLGPGHLCADVAVLLVSELFANSIRHFGSGVPGEVLTVGVTAGIGVVRVRSPIAAGLRCRNCGLSAVTRTAAEGSGWWRAWRRDGAGGDVTSGR
jgi:hypothetical protein